MNEPVAAPPGRGTQVRGGGADGVGTICPDTEHTEEGTSVRYLVCLSKDTETSPDAYRLCKRLTHPKKRWSPREVTA